MRQLAKRNGEHNITGSDNEMGVIAMSDDLDLTEVELTIVTIQFDASDDRALLAVLSKYIVLTRMTDGCRNVDLCSSVTHPGRHLLIQKWESPERQQQHFDSTLMVEMAESCVGILSGPPDVDLWDATSAHDLR